MQNYDILPFRVSLLEHPVLNCSELFRIVLICSELFSSAPEGSVDAYKVADTWKDFFNIEPTGINRVEADASAAGWYSSSFRCWADRRFSARGKNFPLVLSPRLAPSFGWLTLATK